MVLGFCGGASGSCSILLRLLRIPYGILEVMLMNHGAMLKKPEASLNDWLRIIQGWLTHSLSIPDAFLEECSRIPW